MKLIKKDPSPDFLEVLGAGRTATGKKDRVI